MSETITSARATAKYVRTSSLKASRLLDLVRGKSVSEALAILKYAPQDASKAIAKVIASAAANAENNFGADVDELRVSEIMVDEGPVMKRIMPRAKGRADRIQKRTSHITVRVAAK